MTPRAGVDSRAFREESVSIFGRSPGGSGGMTARVMFVFLLGNRVPTGLGDSVHSAWQPVLAQHEGPFPIGKSRTSVPWAVWLGDLRGGS